MSTSSMSENLQNSTIINPSEALSLTHARLCQSLQNAKIIAKAALDTYDIRNKAFLEGHQKESPPTNKLSYDDINNLLWILHPALGNIIKILEAVENE